MDDAPLTPPAPARPALAIEEIVALAPAGLVERLATLVADLDRAYAPNTKRVWRASWRGWVAFCRASEPSWPVLPVSVDSLRAFLEARIAAGIQRATLEGNLASLAMVHALAGLPWPLGTIEGKLMWRGLRRALPARQHQKDGLTWEKIEPILAKLDPAVPRDARDAAMIAVAYETQLRRSSLVALDVAQVRWESDDTALVLVAKAKEDQEGQGRWTALSVETARRLRHWLALAGLTDGALFRRCPRANQPDRVPEWMRAAQRLRDGEVARIYKRRAIDVGLKATEIAGHSTRIGAAQDLVAAGFQTPEILQQVGWKSERMLARYTERLQAKRGAMARLAQRRASDAPDRPLGADEELNGWPPRSA